MSSSGDHVISVEGLSKRYALKPSRPPGALRDALTQGARELLRWPWGRQAAVETKEIWALRDVSFDVRQGEAVGVIGRNGAGKSTLLKILSRITEPTTGRARLRGRVASLLEVGTGFHPELTGRENVFLNGAILGMGRSEIQRRFDEIVAFAEVSPFIDIPVKRYSSGMHVRLAFAVAAHLEPEILIVDEVLAVGDLAFQKKCLGRMQDSSRKQGRTVLFVSHNLSAIRELCPRTILLSSGKIEMQGETAGVLRRYALGFEGEHARSTFPPGDRPERQTGHFTFALTESIDGRPASSFSIGEPWQLRVGFTLSQPQPNLVVAGGLSALDGTPVETTWSVPRDLPAGRFEARFRLARANLAAGTYRLIIGLSQSDRAIEQLSAGHVDIVAEGARGYVPMAAGAGFVLNSFDVTVQPAD